MNIPVPTIQTTISVVLPLIAAILVNRLIQHFIHVPKNLESPRTRTYMSVAKSVVTIIIYLTAAYFVFIALKVNVTPLFASAGIVGIIVGLGVRSFIEDFFTGVFILTEDTLSVGDYVDIGGSEGIAEAIGLRTVRIRDQNGALHIFPNREIKKIINYSRRQARVVIDIPIKTNQPIDRVLRQFHRALTLLKKDPEVGRHIHDGSTIQGIENVSGSTILIRSLILTRAPYRWAVSRTFKYLILKELEREKLLLG